MDYLSDEALAAIIAAFPLDDCLAAPDLEVTPATAAVFENLAGEILAEDAGLDIAYDLPYPRYLFLDYLAATRGWLFHGSPRTDLDLLQPVRHSSDSSEFGDQAAIYATQDPIWAMFFAVLDRSRLKGPIMNGAIRLEGDDGDPLRRYYFCVEVESLRRQPWRDGAIYLLPPAGFEPDPAHAGVAHGDYRLVATHWLNRDPVQPLARLAVTPEDFPYRDRVWGFDLERMQQQMAGGNYAGWPFLSDPGLYPVMPDG